MERKRKGGRPETYALFIQYPNTSSTLEEQPYDLDTFREKFLELSEYNGYTCAQAMLTEVPKKDRWSEWIRLFHKSTVLNKHFKEWQAELEDVLRAKASQIIAEGGSPTDIQRAKLILSGDLFGKRKGAGRPTKGSQRGARVDPKDIPPSEGLDNLLQLRK